MDHIYIPKFDFYTCSKFSFIFLIFQIKKKFQFFFFFFGVGLGLDMLLRKNISVMNFF